MDELMNNEKLKERLANAETKEQILEILREQGILLREEELESLMAEPAEGELEETALENVSGGSFLSWLGDFLRTIWGPKRFIDKGRGGSR